jgi:hypothetical protein
VESLGRFKAILKADLRACQPTEADPAKLFQVSLEGAKLRPYSDRMTNALTAAIAATKEEVAAVENLVERYEKARTARDSLRDGDRDFMLIQQDVVNQLRPGRTWAEVGSMLGITGSRAEQVAKGRGTSRHAAESTPHAGAAEGHSPDVDQPDQ